MKNFFDYTFLPFCLDTKRSKNQGCEIFPTMPNIAPILPRFQTRTASLIQQKC
jgi:hypothetical protein